MKMKPKKMMPDCELGEPKKLFSETFSAVTVLKEKFFSVTDKVVKNK